MDLELLEARIAEELGAAALDLWHATGSDPAAHLGAAPPVLGADDTRRVLARAAALPGDAGVRAAALHRIALATAFAAADRARLIPPAERTEPSFLAAAAARAVVAARLGYADLWSLAVALHGDFVAAPAVAAPAARSTVDVGPILADPRPLIAALATAHRLDAGAITHVDLAAAAAPAPGRTFVVAPGRDLRIRIWRRPDATSAGTLRVLLHELGHAFLSIRDPAPPPRAVDEGVAAWFASLLERPAFNRDVLRLSPSDADRLAATEQSARAARRARLLTAATAERAFYLAAAPAPWRAPLAWTDPGASAPYAAAESLRDTLDATLGPSWPTRPLEVPRT